MVGFRRISLTVSSMFITFSNVEPKQSIFRRENAGLAAFIVGSCAFCFQVRLILVINIVILLP